MLRAPASDRPPRYRRAPKGSAVDAVELGRVGTARKDAAPFGEPLRDRESGAAGRVSPEILGQEAVQQRAEAGLLLGRQPIEQWGLDRAEGMVQFAQQLAACVSNAQFGGAATSCWSHAADGASLFELANSGLHALRGDSSPAPQRAVGEPGLTRKMTQSAQKAQRQPLGLKGALDLLPHDPPQGEQQQRGAPWG